VNADHLWTLASAVSATAAWQTRTAAVAQAGDELAAQFASGMGIDRGIDSFVKHLELALKRKDAPEGSRYGSVALSGLVVSMR
jgi:hypothetical protein